MWIYYLWAYTYLFGWVVVHANIRCRLWCCLLWFDLCTRMEVIRSNTHHLQILTKKTLSIFNRRFHTELFFLYTSAIALHLSLPHHSGALSWRLSSWGFLGLSPILSLFAFPCVYHIITKFIRWLLVWYQLFNLHTFFNNILSDIILWLYVFSWCNPLT
jgi:hypothetical protein